MIKTHRSWGGVLGGAFIVSSLLAGFASSAQDLGDREESAGPIVEGRQISLSTETNPVRQGDRVSLVITVLNHSDRTLYVTRTNGPDYAFRVTGPDGKSAELTRWGKLLMQVPRNPLQKEIPQPTNFGYRSAERIPPGKSVSEKLVLNTMYDMTVYGDYSVQVSRDVNQEDGKAAVRVTSNRLKVSVANSSG